MKMSTQTISPPQVSAQRGVSLVELMVALIIALILTGGVIQIFLGSNQTYRLVEALSRVQENGRYAVNTLTRDIREAGGLGCMRNFQIEVASPIPAVLQPGRVRIAVNDSTSWEWDLSRYIEGFYGEGIGSGHSPALPTGFPAALDNSDVLIIRSVQDAGANVVGPPPATPATLLAPDNDLRQGDIVMVGDCQSAAVFQVTNANPGSGSVVHNTGAAVAPGNRTQNLGRTFEDSGEIIRIGMRGYFVANNPAGRPSLYVYRRDSTGALVSMELVEGVEQFRVMFGVDNNNDQAVDRYLNAADVDAAGAWENVVSSRISLLLVSNENNVVDQPQQIVFDGATITPTDRRLRQVVTTTVGLRNRLP